jgi:hypothetical protein
MVNKKIWLGILAMVLVFGVTVVGCTTAIGVKELGDTFSAKDGESEIILLGPSKEFAENSNITVTLDDEQKGIMRGDGTARFIIPNGQHTLVVTYQGTGIFSGPKIKSEMYNFTTNSNKIEFRIVLPITRFNKFTIQQVNSTPLRLSEHE